ncbi:MAG: hypothetical protein IJU10_00425 [Clostridia bacterium]|nr:hypothetical protein [Clostridia bacterium]
MSKEKKLRDYAESRLSAYADGEDSLARLKEAQATAAPEKKVPWRRYVLRIATSLSVLVVVVVAAILAAQGFFGGGMATDSEKAVENNAPSGVSPRDSASEFVPNYDAIQDAEKGSAALNVNVNAETEHVEVVLPEDASVEKVNADEGYYYAVSLRDGSLDAIIAFEGAEPVSAAFDTDKESTVAGLPFEYTWTYGIALRGKIATDCETIYITHCAGEDEADALDTVRSVFTEK